MRATLLTSLLLLLTTTAMANEKDKLRQRLEWFQDQRFGLFIHWGIYAELGCIESWPMVWADRSWANPTIETFQQLEEFRKKYRSQNRNFNPTQFRPAEWARLAKRAGMKYVVFTTKHHDGFCMFDTRLTDYKVTSPDCPWSGSPQADITRAVFDAFRAEGLGIGVYFSKSDWHSPWYWDPARRADDRNPNYDTSKEPQRWEKFVQFAHGQVLELCENYGQIDILWLDGGQVRPPAQDLRMDELVANARKLQPELIVVDRTVGGEHENYLTPEQTVPDKPLDQPWESCVTMATQWSYKPDDQYKSTRELIHLLVDIVAKGGNLLLNVGPDAKGNFPQEAVKRLEEIGQWMRINGEAIHGTRPIEPYKDGRVALTRKGRFVYAIYLAADDSNALPAAIELTRVHAVDGTSVTMLGSDATLAWRQRGDGMIIEVPQNLAQDPPTPHAVVFKIEAAASLAR